jgi:hypothetical protein
VRCVVSVAFLPESLRMRGGSRPCAGSPTDPSRPGSRSSDGRPGPRPSRRYVASIAFGATKGSISEMG